MRRHVFIEESEVIQQLAEFDLVKRNYEKLKEAVLKTEGYENIETENVPYTVMEMNKEIFIEKYIYNSMFIK